MIMMTDDDFLAEGEKAMLEALRKDEPDDTITVYCDHHLRVKMLRGRLWASVECGENSANLSFLLDWFCPRPDCSRRYEPTTFGYYWHRVGTLPELNLSKQHCENHPAMPFMYIGRVGQGRQFFCPLYRCAERGPQVVGHVEDESVEPPANPLNDLRDADRKRAIEMSVFRAFARSSGLEIDEASVESRDPDYPDIECMISDQKYFFELGEIISEEVAEKLNPKRRTPEGCFRYDQKKPLVDIVRKKTEKTYTTDGAPVDLILHFNLRLGTVATVARLIERNPKLLDSLSTAGRFKRVWVFDEHNQQIIWKSAP